MPQIPTKHKTPTRGSGAVTRWRGGLQLLACSLVCLAFTGCRTTGLGLAAKSPQFRPDNIFKFSNLLDANVRRVAVLPLASVDSRTVLMDGCEALQPVILAELIKTKRFEVVCITPQMLRARTSREVWSAADTLPVDFFEILREVHGCDAVLFTELTEYRAYAPVAVGWRFRLVDARSKHPLWAGDELFDARRPEVAGAARRASGSTGMFGTPPGSDWAVLHSPRQFAAYTVAQMFDTLPVR